MNRLLMPYLAEALQVVTQGGDPEVIDETLTRFGMPMGPLALLDQIGLDVAAKVAGVLVEAFGERLPSPRGLEAMAQAGYLGSKSGSGFFVHSGKKKQINAKALDLVRNAASGTGSTSDAGSDGVKGPPPTGDQLVRRLLYPIINEAARSKLATAS